VSGSGFPPQEALEFDAIFVQYGKDIQAWRDNLEDDVRYHQRRLIGGFSESETQQFLANFTLPVAVGMDPRYIPLGPGHSVGSEDGEYSVACRNRGRGLHGEGALLSNTWGTRVGEQPRPGKDHRLQLCRR
jgi:hypothetical protein